MNFATLYWTKLFKSPAPYPRYDADLIFFLHFLVAIPGFPILGYKIFIQLISFLENDTLFYTQTLCYILYPRENCLKTITLHSGTYL